MNFFPVIETGDWLAKIRATTVGEFFVKKSLDLVLYCSHWAESVVKDFLNTQEMCEYLKFFHKTKFKITFYCNPREESQFL